MKFLFIRSYIPALLLLIFSVFSCKQKSNIPQETPLTITEDSITGLANAKEARETIVPILAEGFTLDLWASDSLAPDPIAMDIDDQGNVYLTRTNRQKNSEFDIRGYQEWMTPSIAFETVEDRRKFLHETFAPEKSEENHWLKDLNNDSISDWKDFTVEKEEVWKLTDVDGNGIADKSVRILEDFNEEITDVAGALLVDGDDVYVGVGPDMWKLTDTNDDGVLDTKVSLAHGFAVHIGFSGHGMSGAVRGPDGKIYWGIGDIGAHITDLAGNEYHYPNQGVIVRCNPDGSDFEVFARGLRNTHEFVFDEFGNIISSDNDGDHRGESERLVHIVEGSDAGWRANWQYGKYTDPKNNGYKVWMDEKLFVPRWEGQAAYIIPPIMNYHNGPTGMRLNPGTALGKKWLNKFFLVEFVGDPSLSHIWAFDLKPKGASFELNEETDVLSGVLPTGIEFGPDGALYLADWLNGWGTKNAGRVWKLDVTENDLEAERKETQRLMTLNYADQGTDELVNLLQYPDMRIRQKAQFELAERTFWGYRALKKVITEEKNQYARLHAIWALGMMGADNASKAEPLVALLTDNDPEIAAQAAKVLGDIKYEGIAEILIEMLGDEYPRKRFYAAQALGRLKHQGAKEALVNMIVDNADQDVYIRHAAVLALSRIGDEAFLSALADSDNRSARIAGVLALRRMNSPNAALFLKDSDEYIVTEAARAINDDWSIEEALPALAKVMNETRFTSEPLLRRSINAALRLGGNEQLEDLIAFANREGVSSVLKGEALATIGTWAEPSVLDRVDGRYRGVITRDAQKVKEKIIPHIPNFLGTNDENILLGTSKILASLNISDFNSDLRNLFNRHASEKVRSGMLEALGQLDYPETAAIVQKGMNDSSMMVRRSAIELVSKLDLDAQQLPQIVAGIFQKGSKGEQQAMINVLGEFPLEKSQPVLQSLIHKAARNQLAPEVILDLLETVEKTGSAQMMAELDPLKKLGYGTQEYKETLYGGQYWPGWQVFSSNPTAQCVRCHAVGGAGGQVGPPLDNIGNTLNREQLLESLVNPNARLAPGYGSVVLNLTDGNSVTGVLISENSQEIVLKTTDAEPLKIAQARVASRENLPSGMPPMGLMISKRELRDLIEFLTTLKTENEREAGSH
jgi:putative membrane-bound dehydrogenase-like protein